ncbi:MAG: glycogen synthase GlgA [Lachnospiraceae bacterium]|nr:glycogen synthase GlgA [Lachnospiraceae bacterium]
MEKIKVLFAASECVPFIKTGGLADVAGSLPKYFNSEKYDVRVMMPKYTCIRNEYREKMEYVTHFYTDFCSRNQYVGIFRLDLDGVRFYFLDSEFYFSGSWPYGSPCDDIEKFAFFSRMVLSALPLIDWKPDILHCHDWQTGLVPVYLNDSFQGNRFFPYMTTVMTIHTLKVQGVWDIPTVMEKTGLSPYYFTPDKLEAYNAGNMLKGGLVYADRITTVSDTYAKEIQTPFYGEGLDGLMRARADKLVGIVNGIDTTFYNPGNDKDIAAPYGIGDALEKKKQNKLALQKELGLKQDPDAFVLGVVSRLTDQKGFDLVDCVMNQICSLPNIQFVILGTGEKRYENMFRYYASLYPDRVSAQIYYSEAMSHRIYASTDAFLMPSLFEPCGLSQLMALRYGSLPIVRETGGLKDTVEPYNEFTKEGTGFSFANYNAHEMLAIITYAKHIYEENRKDWDDMVIRAMKQDFSWEASARKYEALYDELMEEKLIEQTPADI